jgi:hypothetical protein
VTAPEPLRPAAEALVIEMGGEPVFIAEENRALYHAALAFAANHLVTLVAEAASLLATAGADNPGRMLGPLLGAALDNALRFGDAGLTGPVARGDADTVAAHVAALRASAPGGAPAYLALARLTADRALAAGRSAAPDAQRLLDVLGRPDDRRQRTRAELARPPRQACPARWCWYRPWARCTTGTGRCCAGPASWQAERDGAVSIFVNPLQFGPTRTSTSTRAPWTGPGRLRARRARRVFAPERPRDVPGSSS